MWPSAAAPQRNDAATRGAAKDSKNVTAKVSKPSSQRAVASARVNTRLVALEDRSSVAPVPFLRWQIGKPRVRRSNYMEEDRSEESLFRRSDFAPPPGLSVPAHVLLMQRREQDELLDEAPLQQSGQQPQAPARRQERGGTISRANASRRKTSSAVGKPKRSSRNRDKDKKQRSNQDETAQSIPPSSHLLNVDSVAVKSVRKGEDTAAVRISDPVSESEELDGHTETVPVVSDVLVIEETTHVDSHTLSVDTEAHPTQNTSSLEEIETPAEPVSDLNGSPDMLVNEPLDSVDQLDATMFPSSDELQSATATQAMPDLDTDPSADDTEDSDEESSTPEDESKEPEAVRPLGLGDGSIFNTQKATPASARANSAAEAPVNMETIFSKLLTDGSPRESTSALLLQQGHACFSCKTAVADKFFGGAQYCHYTRKLFCSNCMHPTGHVIPGYALRSLDLQEYAVCTRAHEYLSMCFEVPNVNLFLFPEVYSMSRELRASKALRVQLGHMEPYVATCRQKRRLLAQLADYDYMLSDDVHLYSLKDYLAVLEGTLTPILHALAESLARHIVDGRCTQCYSKGHFCNGDGCQHQTPVFPFQIYSVSCCSRCNKYYHKQCFAVSRCARAECAGK